MTLEIATSKEPWSSMAGNGKKEREEYLATPEGKESLKRASKTISDTIDELLIRAFSKKQL